jgi:hypothetical protein
VYFANQAATEEYMNFLDEIQEVFMLGMAHGYAASSKKTKIRQLPNVKCIPFAHGRFTMLDMYVANGDSGNSTGTTTIWCKDIPVWTMHYGGNYPKAVLPFLKRTLLQAYTSEKRFYRGRGPIYFHTEDSNSMFYINDIEHGKERIDDFAGEEKIFVDGKVAGRHWYRGMFLPSEGTRIF